MNKAVALIFSFLFLNQTILTVSSNDSFKQYFLKGQAAFEQGQYESAIKSFNQALEIDPNSAETYNALGLVYRNMNANLDEIIWYFEVASDIDPSYVSPYENLGTLYFRLKKFDLAEENLKKALSLNPELTSSQFTLAWVYLNDSSQTDEAIFYFKKVLEKTEIPNALFGLGLAYAQNDNIPLVLEIITKLRDQDQKEWASNLEEMIRGGDADVDGGMANIPPSQPAQIPTAAVSQPSLPTSAAMDGTMRVRMRGTLYNINDQNTPEQSPRPTPPRKNEVLKSK